MRIYTITFLALFVSGSAIAAATPDLVGKLTPLLNSDICQATGKNPIPLLRAEIDRLRKDRKSKPSLKDTIKAWQDDEEMAGKPNPNLGWLRALDPWTLPKDFASKTAFERCAATLTEIAESDVKASLVSDWTECVDLLYTGEKPAEFVSLRKCLEARQTPDPSN